VAAPNKTVAGAGPVDPRDHPVIGPKIQQLVALARESDQLAGIKGYADGDARMARVEKLSSQLQALNAEIRQLLQQAGYDPAKDFPLGAKIDELNRLGQEALKLGNSITIDNATEGLARLEAIKLRVPKLNAEIRELVEREAAAGPPAQTRSATAQPADWPAIQAQVLELERQLQASSDASYKQMRGWAAKEGLAVVGSVFHYKVMSTSPEYDKHVADMQRRVDAENAQLIKLANDTIDQLSRLEAQCPLPKNRAYVKEGADGIRKNINSPK
jgi:DNA repair exonuclease SbcCD ATPase subunit